LRIGGRILAIARVAATGRRFPAVSSAEALRRVAPALRWRGTPLELVADNVRHPARRRARDRLLAALGAPVADPRYRPNIGCRTSG
jgi:hypothetical protein